LSELGLVKANALDDLVGLAAAGTILLVNADREYDVEETSQWENWESMKLLIANGYVIDPATDVNAGLMRCGLGADAADVLARNAEWRMSEGEWLRIFDECFEHPDRSHLVRAAVSFDFRQSLADFAMEGELGAR